jgi:chromosomal replication initiator protein
MDIARTVAKEFKITIKDMRSKARDQEIILPRQVTMFLAREISRMHYTQIAEFFGIKSHTTVMHSCHKLATQLTTDSTLDYQVNQIKQKIQGFDHLPK